VPQEMVIVNVKISVDEKYTTPVDTEIIIDVKIQVDEGGSFRCKGTGLLVLSIWV
jgi:hypothetical protein